MNQHRFNTRGQATLLEYGLVFSVVISFLFAMSTFFQRGFQARSRDSSVYMTRRVSEAFGNAIDIQYEPYYGNVEQYVDTTEHKDIRLIEGTEDGVFLKSINSEVNVDATSIQLPPREAD